MSILIGRTGEDGTSYAQIIAFFLDHRLLYPYEKLDDLVQSAIVYFLNDCDVQEMHELFCYLSLMERLDESQQALLDGKMQRFLDNCISTDPQQREGYGAEPLQAADSPKSKYFPKYASMIPH